VSASAQTLELPPPSFSGNGHELPQEEELARARRHIRDLASDGLSVSEILRRVERGFNDTERDLIWLIATHEVDQVSRPGATRR
jgi:hypothetical protein